MKEYWESYNVEFVWQTTIELLPQSIQNKLFQNNEDGLLKNAVRLTIKVNKTYQYAKVGFYRTVLYGYPTLSCKSVGTVRVVLIQIAKEPMSRSL
jgi:hypothetical protein